MLARFVGFRPGLACFGLLALSGCSAPASFPFSGPDASCDLVCRIFDLSDHSQPTQLQTVQAEPARPKPVRSRLHKPAARGLKPIPVAVHGPARISPGAVEQKPAIVAPAAQLPLSHDIPGSIPIKPPWFERARERARTI
jgi:hypothetical protein